MTTKEQERKALAQIRKIVEGLGENSYVGTAFEGCFEKAEQNIEWDTAFSMKGEIEMHEQHLRNYAKRTAEYEHELATVKKELERVRKWYEDDETALEDKQKELNEACKKVTELIDVKYDLTAQIEAKDLEIMKLKARLFDLIDKQ